MYFVDDRPFTTAARVRAAVWSSGQLAVASGLAAAWWLGLAKREPATIEVTVPRNSHGRAGPGIRLRRRDLAEEDVVDCRGLRVTAPALTALEAATRIGGDAAIIDNVLQRGGVRLVELQRAHRRNSGRHGSAAARRMLEAAAGGARSEAERRVLRLLRGAGITGWQANYPVGRYVVDFAFPAQRVAVEIDGWAFHSDQQAFQTDRNRQNTLLLQGWTVLRFTWLDITRYPDRVLAEIAAAISAC